MAYLFLAVLAAVGCTTQLVGPVTTWVLGLVVHLCLGRQTLRTDPRTWAVR